LFTPALYFNLTTATFSARSAGAIATVSVWMPADTSPAAAPEPGAIPGLEVAGLTRRYGSTVAVDALSFRVRPGEILALLGPNGAGKTTTLMCLAGLVRPDAGRISLRGEVLGSSRGRQIALIPETPEVYEMLTVWEHLVFVARSCRLPEGWRERAERLLERLDLRARRDSLGEALSKGMRQKLLVAAAVLAATPVLLLDEPMIGLDPRGQRELREIILEVRGEGVAVVVSTHLLDNVQSFCDRLLILKKGRAVAEGGLRELLDRYGGKSLEQTFLEIVE
jgi:ABC-2 type transport system ATP-binding protein